MDSSDPTCADMICAICAKYPNRTDIAVNEILNFFSRFFQPTAVFAVRANRIANRPELLVAMNSVQAALEHPVNLIRSSQKAR
jgi:hypothetical protein